MPQLKVLRASDSRRPARSISQRKTGGGSQASSSICAAVSPSSTLGRFSVSPPPVIWAIARTPPAASAARTGFTYILVGASSASPRVSSANGLGASQPRPLSPTTRRTSE